MKVEENEYLIIYLGHNITSLLYQRLLKRSCRVDSVSTPTRIYSGCSHAIRFKETYMDIVIEEIGNINIKPKGLYRIVKNGRLESYEKIKLK